MASTPYHGGRSVCKSRWGRGEGGGRHSFSPDGTAVPLGYRRPRDTAPSMSASTKIIGRSGTDGLEAVLELDGATFVLDRY